MSNTSGVGELSGYFRSVGRQQMMKPEEELEVARRWRDTGSQRYADRLVSANLRFVIKIALEYRNYGFPMPDLIQEGNVGLVRSVQSFDPDRGFRLISYGVWWIRAYIQEYILRNWSLVKMGTTQLQRRLFNHLQSSQKRLDQRLSEDDEQHRRARVAKAVGGTVRDVEDMEHRLHSRDLSLDRTFSNDDGGTTLQDSLPGEGPDAEAMLEECQVIHLQNRELNRALNQLNHRERHILERRHLTEQSVTLRELGEQLGVSKERVRQLESRALRSLKGILNQQSADLPMVMAG